MYSICPLVARWYGDCVLFFFREDKLRARRYKVTRESRKVFLDLVQTKWKTRRMKGKVDDEIRDCERVGWVMDFVSLFAVCTQHVAFFSCSCLTIAVWYDFLFLFFFFHWWSVAFAHGPFFLRVIRSPQRHSSSSSSQSMTKYIRAVDAFARSNYTRFDQTTTNELCNATGEKGM